MNEREGLPVNKDDQAPQNGPEKDPGLVNVMKLIFLIAVLVGAWFLLDWLMNGR